MRSRERTVLLMALLAGLFVWVGSLVGGFEGAVVAFIIAGLMNLWAYWFSDRMILRHYRAEEVGPGDRTGLYRTVAALPEKGRLPMPKIYRVPLPTPNVFATGRNPDQAAVAATDGILGSLDQDELEGVMAHELTHIKNRDTLTSTIAATMAGAVALMAQFSRGGGSGSSRRRQNPLAVLFLLIGAPLGAMLIQMMISRVREYAADQGGAGISGKPLGLANALRKLQQGVQRRPLMPGNPAHSHLFIVNSFPGGLDRLFSTHPPVEERIRRLEAMAAGQGSED